MFDQQPSATLPKVLGRQKDRLQFIIHQPHEADDHTLAAVFGNEYPQLELFERVIAHQG
jgi:hypothetical protein